MERAYSEPEQAAETSNANAFLFPRRPCRSAAVAGQTLVTVVFLYLTTPIAAHRVARAAWKSGVSPWAGTRTNELGPPPEAIVERSEGSPAGAGDPGAPGANSDPS